VKIISTVPYNICICVYHKNTYKYSI